MYATLGDAGTQTHSDQTGTGPSGAGAAAAAKAAARSPGAAPYNADQSWLSSMQRSNYLALPASRAALESYYKLLPALTRGHAVPSGYPVGFNGLLIQDNTLPRIVALTPGNPLTTAIAWTPTNIPGAQVGKPMKLSTFLADPATVQVVKGVTWWNPKYKVYASYAPHILFNDLFQQHRIFADPLSGWSTNAYKNWEEDPPLKTLLIDAIVVAAAIGGAYALAPLNGTASASLASTTVTAGAAPTASTPIATTSYTAGGATPLAPVSASAVGAPVSVAAAGAPTAAGGSSLLSTVATAGSTAGKVLATAGGVIKAVTGKAKAPIATPATGGQAAVAAAPKSVLSSLALPAGAAAILWLLLT